MARTYRSIPGQVNQAVDSADASGDVPLYAAAASTEGGWSYANCPAATDTAVKASAGVLAGLWILPGSAAGTVTVKDSSTSYAVIPTTANGAGFAMPLPPGGVTHGTNIHVVTSGTAVTATAFYK